MGNGEGVLCRICDEQFWKKMIDQHAKYCSKVRGIERKFKISSNEILTQLEEAVKARLLELEDLSGKQTKDSVRKCAVLEQMSEILSRLQRVEEEATGVFHYRSAFAQIEEDMKTLKVGMSFNESCDSPDAAIGPFSYLLSRILSERKASLGETIRNESKKPHLFGLEKFCDAANGSGGEDGFGGAVSEPKVTIHDFEMVKPISSGAFGKVWLARKTKSGDLYAVKIIRKSDMVRKNMQEHVSNERNVMELASNNSFLVDFFYAFQSDDHVYLVMEFIQVPFFSFCVLFSLFSFFSFFSLFFSFFSLFFFFSFFLFSLFSSIFLLTHSIFRVGIVALCLKMLVIWKRLWRGTTSPKWFLPSNIYTV